MPNPTPVNPYRHPEHSDIVRGCVACEKSIAWAAGRVDGSQQGKDLAELVKDAEQVRDFKGTRDVEESDWQAMWVEKMTFPTPQTCLLYAALVAAVAAARRVWRILRSRPEEVRCELQNRYNRLIARLRYRHRYDHELSSGPA